MRFDFRRYFGLSLDAVGRRGGVRWSEAIDLVLELKRETGSHLYADMVGLDMAASQAELASILHAEWYVNMPRVGVKPLKKRLELPHPWVAKDPNADVTPEQRAALRAKLLERSAFRDME